MVKKKTKKLPPGVRERNGRFTYRYSVDVVVDGKRQRKQKETPSFPTAKEAYDAGVLIEADKQRGKLVDTKNLTLGQWRDRWLEDYELEREPRPTTLRNRKVALNSFVNAIGENVRMKEIGGDTYQGWLNGLKKAGKKQTSIRDYHSGCRIFFADAVRKQILSESPATNAVVPAFKSTIDEITNNKVPKFLEKKQLKHLLNIIRFRGRPQEYEVFTLLAYTGLRIGELLALKTEDFDESERTLTITKTVTILSGVSGYTLGPPKNNSSIRIVSIGDTPIRVLKNQIAWRDARKERGESQHDGDFIFWSNSKPGFPASPGNLQERFKELLDLADLPRILTPHSLRHTHVSLLAEAGEDLAVIQERLGHKNDDITRRVYLHVTEKRRKAAPDKFESVMSL